MSREQNVVNLFDVSITFRMVLSLAESYDFKIYHSLKHL